MSKWVVPRKRSLSSQKKAAKIFLEVYLMKTLVKEKNYPQCQKAEKLSCDNCLSCLSVYSILEKEQEKEGKKIEKCIR